MKDHEIIAAIEQALESADPAQRERIEAWARARFGAPGQAVSAPQPQFVPMPYPVPVGPHPDTVPIPWTPDVHPLPWRTDPYPFQPKPMNPWPYGPGVGQWDIICRTDKGAELKLALDGVASALANAPAINVLVHNGAVLQ
jgi:hypothetical protein